MSSRAKQRANRDPRTERALRFLVPLLAAGPLPYLEIRRLARREHIKEQALFRASNEAGIAYITKAGEPVLWEWTGQSPYGQPPRTYSESEEPVGAQQRRQIEPASESAGSGRGALPAARTHDQSETSRNPGNATVVDPSMRRPASRSTGLVLDEGEVEGQMVLWVGCARV